MSRKTPIVIFVLVFCLVYIPFIRNFGLDLVHEDSDDFPSYYFGAQLAFRFRLSPYDLTSWKTVPIEFAGDNGKFYPFLYPPPSLTFFWPFTILDYAPAQQAMLMLNHILVLAFAGLLLVRILKIDIGSWISLAFILYIFTFSPLSITIVKGQANLIVLLLLELTWVALKEGKGPFAIGTPLALAIVLKQNPILFLIVIWLRKQRGTVLWILILLLLISTFGFFALPRETWLSWYGNVASKGYAQSVLGLNLSTPANQSINAMLDRFFFGRNVRFPPVIEGAPLWMTGSAAYVLSGAVVGLSLLASYKARRKNGLYALDLDFSLWALVAFLIAPISWDHHLVFLLPGIFVLLNYLIKTNANILTLLTVAAIAVFLAFPYPSNSPAFREGLKTLLISGPLYAVSLLWLINLVVVVRLPVKQSHNDPDSLPGFAASLEHSPSQS